MKHVYYWVLIVLHVKEVIEKKHQNACNYLLLLNRCADHYYNINGVSDCAVCSYLCGRCEINSTNCLSCNVGDNRNLFSENCRCLDGYFDKNPSINCYACSY